MSNSFLAFLGNYVLTYLPIWCIIKTPNEGGVFYMKFTDVNGKVFYYYGKLILNSYEKEHKRLSYSNMLKALTDDCYILNNTIADKFYFDFLDESMYDLDELTIYQYYIISEYTAEKLQKHTNEIILYNKDLDMYLLGVGHFGTSWNYVLTDIEIEGD